jgi:hypothetical protein
MTRDYISNFYPICGDLSKELKMVMKTTTIFQTEHMELDTQDFGTSIEPYKCKE